MPVEQKFEILLGEGLLKSIIYAINQENDGTHSIKGKMGSDRIKYSEKVVDRTQAGRSSKTTKSKWNNNSASGYVKQKETESGTLSYHKKTNKKHYSGSEIIKEKNKEIGIECNGLLKGFHLEVYNQKRTPTKETSNRSSINLGLLETGVQYEHSKARKDEFGNTKSHSYQIGFKNSVDFRKILPSTSFSLNVGKETSTYDSAGNLISQNGENIIYSVNTKHLLSGIGGGMEIQNWRVADGEKIFTSDSTQMDIYNGSPISGVGLLNHGAAFAKKYSYEVTNQDGEILRKGENNTTIALTRHKIGVEKERISNDGTSETVNTSAHVVGGRNLFKWKNNESKTMSVADSQNSEISAPEQPAEQLQKSPEQKTYKRAEIKHIWNEDGQSRQFTEVDGKKHGADICFNENGDITQVDLYNQGVKMELTEDYRVDLLRTSDENGKVSSVLLNGKPFGAVMSQDSEGKIQAEFYDLNGKIPPANDAEVVINVVDNRPQEAPSKEAVKQQMQEDASKAHIKMISPENGLILLKTTVKKAPVEENAAQKAVPRIFI